MSRQQAATMLRNAHGTVSARQPVGEQSRERLPADRLGLAHQMMGNRATGHWVLAQLKVNVPIDAPAQGADGVAEQGMRMRESASLQINAAPPAIQRKCATCEEEEMSAAPLAVQRKCQHCEEEKNGIQRKESSSGPRTAPPIVQKVLSSAGHPLDGATRAFMEPHFGHD
ncbi:MAG TPA: hypothetical protein VE133_14920, partial [Candidatus Sulfotelmatobacter sp.]|nr:hypothetical protein [Candidatus Sulfotelmatobacter sp.]